MSERTRDGLAAAHAPGRTGGQDPNVAHDRSPVQAMYDETGADGKRSGGRFESLVVVARSLWR